MAPLLRLNHCHLAEAEKTLLMHQKYPELIILYQTKGQHKKALELLEKHAKENDSSLKGTERTIQYLQHLGKDHMDLILKFAGWVLTDDPEQGLRIFMEDIQVLYLCSVFSHLLLFLFIRFAATYRKLNIYLDQRYWITFYVSIKT